MKLFISSDIEGTTGITLWDEAQNGHARYPYFANQMSREVAAACQGALDAGYDEILVKDAHGSACNINPAMLPEQACIFRGWGRDPMGMMVGLDSSFDGVVFTGYHAGGGTNTNPLAHTMNSQNNHVKINGQIASELMMNALTAAYVGVPVYCVTGDEGLCGWIRSVNPNIETVAVNRGIGNGTISIHPDKAVRLIREAVASAVRRPAADCMFPLPEHFTVEINYRDHGRAKFCSHYPGATQIDARTIRYEADNYADVLAMFHFLL